MTTLQKWCHVTFGTLRGQVYAAVQCWAKDEMPLMLSQLKEAKKTLDGMILFLERNSKG